MQNTVRKRLPFFSTSLGGVKNVGNVKQRVSLNSLLLRYEVEGVHLAAFSRKWLT